MSHHSRSFRWKLADPIIQLQLFSVQMRSTTKLFDDYVHWNASERPQPFPHRSKISPCSNPKSESGLDPERFFGFPATCPGMFSLAFGAPMPRRHGTSNLVFWTKHVGSFWMFKHTWIFDPNLTINPVGSNIIIYIFSKISLKKWNSVFFGTFRNFRISDFLN